MRKRPTTPLLFAISGIAIGLVLPGKNPARFAVYEIYKDEAAFEAHRSSPHMAETAKVMPDLVAKRELSTFGLIAGGKPKR